MELMNLFQNAIADMNPEAKLITKGAFMGGLGGFLMAKEACDVCENKDPGKAAVVMVSFAAGGGLIGGLGTYFVEKLVRRL